MKISVITICYNNEETIGDTIKSILAQDYQDIEYIVVDGLSKDATLDIVNRNKNEKFRIISEKDEGIYDALNKGISMATGEVIGMLHADDFYADSAVLSRVAAEFENPGIEGVYGDLKYVDRVETSKTIRYWRSGKYTKKAFLWGWMPPHPTFFVRASVYEKYGLFNTKLRSAADYELMLRFIHRHKIKLSYIPFVLVMMRIGGTSNVTVQNRIRANREDHMAWEINGLKPYWFTRYLKPLRKLSQFFNK